MSSVFAVPAGRVAKFVVFFAWLAVIVLTIGTNLPGKFADAEENESTSFLPGDAESTKALQVTERLQGGEQAPMVAIFRREGGLRPADRRTVAERVERFNAERARLAATGDPFPTVPSGTSRRQPRMSNSVTSAAQVRRDTRVGIRPIVTFGRRRGPNKPAFWTPTR